MNPISSLEGLTARMHKAVRERLVLIAQRTGFSKQTIMLDAIMLYVGLGSEEAKRRAEFVQKEIIILNKESKG
jgi:hypothetical protein